MFEPQNMIPLGLLKNWFRVEQSMIEPLPVGLSGSMVWGVRVGDERFVLKSFASSAHYEHAAWVHSLMQHAVNENIWQVPALKKTMNGESIQEDTNGSLWELMQWVPGAPCLRPSLRMAASSGATLAQVHVAMATFPDQILTHDHSPGVLFRISKAAELVKLPFDERFCRILEHSQAATMHEPFSLLTTSATKHALATIANWRSRVVAIQPVLRDVWSEHIFFEDERVSGLIDWHALGFDTPAMDIARLFGSWPDDYALERSFLKSYRSVRRLSDQEERLIPFLKASGIIFGLENWFRWIVEENRYFADKEKVKDRIDSLQRAFPRAIQVLLDGKFDQ